MASKARFVSRYGNFSVGVQSLIKEHFGTGESKVLKPRIDAQFHNHLVTDEDFAVALQSFQFPGLPFDEETNQNVSPRYRVSLWDSEWAQLNEGWTDDQIELIISTLRSDPGFGIDFIELEIQTAKKPFGNYDELSVDEILQIVKIAGIDPESVAAYERENANRKSLIDRLLGVTVVDDAVVVQA